jgi:nicotinamidase/pyrazinamidase
MSAHLRIDEQVDFVPGGTLPVTDGVSAILAGNEIDHCFKKNIKITVFTQDYHPGDHVSFADNHNVSVFSVKEITLPDGSKDNQKMWPNHCVQGMSGAKFHPSQIINTSKPHFVVQKGTNSMVDSYSGFGDAYGRKFEDTKLHELLQEHGIKKVVVTGLAGDYCVAYTAKDAAKLGYKVCVPLWATRAVAEDSFDKEKAEMVALGVTLVKTQEELEAWFLSV